MKFSPNGIHTALITPFTDADEFDEATFRSLIDFQVEAGASGLLVIGGSGEFVSLTPAERQRVVEVAVDQTAGRIPVTVGPLAPGTREVQETTRMAANAQADAVLVLPSFYIKASAPGIYEHFARVGDAADIPIVVYNNTGRTGVNLDIPILQKLSEIPNIVALKECERDLGVVAAKIAAVGNWIAVMSGDDDLGFPTFLLGSPGGIFMTANIVPTFHRQLFEATVNGDLATARKAHYALLKLVAALYTANHPAPLKNAMCRVGHQVGKARTPLQSADPESLRLADVALQEIVSAAADWAKAA
jgi:4-hydroxy-tetrahydrodipicolinate synthase